MQETPEELARLQAVIDRSIVQAGPFLRSAFEMPEHSLSARQILEVFAGNTVIALATTTTGGAPRVAPIGCILIGGVFYVPTTRTAARYRMILKRPAVSLTAFTDVDLAVIVHGQAAPLHEEDALFARVDAALTGLGSNSPRTWGKSGEGCYLAITPETILTYTRHLVGTGE